MVEEQANGSWKKFPKHEQVKMAQHLKRLQMFYEGVLTIKSVPKALFIVDVKKEIAAVREAKRRELPIIGIVDTNSDPRGIDYVIPANDDAVGSIQLIAETMAAAYAEGMKMRKTEEVAQPPVKNGVKKSETADGVKPAEAKKDKEPDVITGVDAKTKVEAVVEAKPVKTEEGKKAKAPVKAAKVKKAAVK
jgi:small subunit ribosomal protein S2